jgi:hypothetical protein
MVIFGHDWLRRNPAEGNARSARRRLKHDNELIHLLFFRNDGLKGRELFLQSVHFALQFNPALLIDAQVGNFIFERFQLSFRGLKICAHALIRKPGNPKAQDYDDNRKAQIENGLKR